MSQASIVLIVDDSPIGREALGELLYGYGYNLVFAGDGPEALKQAANTTPDVILLDVMMPGMDGFEVCRRLRANTDLAEVPVVMVTALDDNASRLRGLEVGADDFITKPFNRAELVARVKTITRLNRYRRMRQEHARFRWMADSAPDAYLLVDDQDHIIYANAQARIYLDLQEEAVGSAAGTFLALAKKYYRCEPEFSWMGWPNLIAPDRERYLLRPETATAKALWLQGNPYGRTGGT